MPARSGSPSARTGEEPLPPEGCATLAISTRNQLPESWHAGAVAVSTPAGRLVARLGDPRLSTFLRSAAKPWQAMPFVTSGGMERYELEAADLALMCASHGGTLAHARRTALLLGRGGLPAAALQCGAHEPFDESAAQALRRAGQQPTELHNNCSGKHAGLLLCCQLHGWKTEDYLAFDHPLELAILDQVAAFCGVPKAAIGVAVDGCGAPTYRLPLAAAARGYAALAAPAQAGIGGAAAAAALRIVAAMTSAPEMVAGPGRFTTRLIEVTEGRVLAKEGAEGYYAVAVRAPEVLGIALKIADGGERGRDGVVLEVLRQLGALSSAEFDELGGFHAPAIFNRRGQEVGEIRPQLALELLS